MQTLLLKINRCSVLCTEDGTDIIFLYPDIESPFPEMKYPAAIEMQARKGYGVEYCKKVLGLEPEVINV